MKNKPAYEVKFHSHIYQLEQYIIRPTNCFRDLERNVNPICIRPLLLEEVLYFLEQCSRLNLLYF